MNETAPPAVTPCVRAARAVTEMTSPAVCATAAIAVVAAKDAQRSADAVWVSLAVLLVTVLPMAFIVIGVRRGRWSDHHVEERAARIAPLLVAAIGVCAAIVLLTLANASRPVLAVVLAMLVGLLVVLAVTRWWKVSIHCAVAAGLLAVLVISFGWAWLSGLALLAVVMWSRVELSAHTWSQAVVGGLLGGLVAATVFPLLR